LSDTGHTEFEADIWYDGLELHGNTSINPFFYGTFLAETKPNEPVTRTKLQAYQADAIGAAHQLTKAHFQTTHTRGGRLDWFVKAYKLNETDWIEGDGKGEEWAHVYTLHDKSLEDLMGSQIPIEPAYIIMNTAVSSTWGFPYDTPEGCNKCYDCNDPRCACSFYPGFCRMLEFRKTAMMIDSIRVYQSRDDSAHIGAPHTVGCDPPDYPTKEWINGHTYRYMRNPPFVYADTGPLRNVQRGGGQCVTDSDCGADVTTENLTAVYEELTTTTEGAHGKRRAKQMEMPVIKGRGRCTDGFSGGMFSSLQQPGLVCTCSPGFTGPHCLSIDHVEDTPSAYSLNHGSSPFRAISSFTVPRFMLYSIVAMSVVLLTFLVARVRGEKRARRAYEQLHRMKPHLVKAPVRTEVSWTAGTTI
jgi:hypothetical protein